jgi:hypothetical protein
MVVDRDRQHLLGALLADHVLIEYVLDLGGRRQLVLFGLLAALLHLFTDDVVAELDTFVADEHGRPRDQLAYLVLALAAEGAVEQLAGIVALAAVIVGHQGPRWSLLVRITMRASPCFCKGATPA